MEFESRRKLLKDNLILGLKRYLVINAIFLFLWALIRVFEYFYLSNSVYLPKGSALYVLIGFGIDILILLNFAGLFLLPFLILHTLYKPLANIVSGFLIVFFVLGQIALIKYFATTSILLGSDLYGYKMKEIIETASASGALSVVTVLSSVLAVLIISYILKKSARINPNPLLSVLFAIISIVSLFFSKYTIPDKEKLNNQLNINLVTNKASHFIRESLIYVLPTPQNEVTLFPYFYTGEAIDSGEPFEYLSEEFHFLRIDNTPDLLGKYITTETNKPNIVIIIVESLGRAYSGKGAYLESFTPFLDSLASHSLYWENALSTSGRTFEVLPSILGSMPYGTSGFAELGKKMPDGFTLVNLLRRHGYVSSFFYGGDAGFDKMGMFLTKQKIDFIYDESNFGDSYSKIPPKPNFTWGYGDKEIFRKGLEVLSQADSTPRLDVYLTLAMHDPFNLPDQDYYQDAVEEKFEKLKFDELRKEEYRKYIKNFSTILYFDDALRYFFDEYKKRDDFNNTIFIITGDHRMSTPPISSEIDRFHVPLVIYSPMLNKSVKFSSVVSHLDITPSVIAFLRESYSLNFPAAAPWLGRGLDSVTYFRSTISMPFIRTKSEIIDYLDKDYFLVRDQLYMISDNLKLNRVTNEKKLVEINRKFEKFKRENIVVTTNDKLIPDSLKF